MANLKELPPNHNIDEEFDLLLEKIATAGVIQLAEYIKNPNKGHFINWRGEHMVHHYETPQGQLAVWGERVCNWINTHFTLLSYDKIFKDGIITRREYTDEDRKGLALIGKKLGSEPSDGDLVIAWKNDPTAVDVPFPISRELEAEQYYDQLANNPGQLTTYSKYKLYIPKNEVSKLPKKLLQLVEEIRATRLVNDLGIQSRGNTGSILYKPEDYGTYYLGNLGQDIVRMIVLASIQRDYNLKSSIT